MMSLNFSQRRIPAHTSKDNLVSPLRNVNGGFVVEGMSEKGGEGLVKQRYRHGELHDRFGHGRGIVDKGGSPESLPTEDISVSLPSDPFGMEIDISTTYTAFSGWLGDLEIDYGEKNAIVSNKEDYGLFAGFNFIWNTAMRFQSFPGNLMCPEMVNSAHYAEEMMCFDHGSMSAVNCEESVNGFVSCPDVIGGDPHEAFVLALSYLGTRDLLSVERVCRSLCVSIRNDPLLWRNLHIDQPLNERITDDTLVQLTNRAEGKLQRLSLIKCPKISDDGLRRVLETNPKLTKLSVPGCTRLSMEGILNNLKAFKSGSKSSGIKHLITGGFYGITLEHFEQLKFLLGIDRHIQNNYNPHYYHRGILYMPFEDNRALDVDVCPRCQNLRLVYDCPAEGCQDIDQGVEKCRACVICIPRCAQCGRCVHNSEYEETFSLEFLCSECVQELLRGHDAHKIEVGMFLDPNDATRLGG